MASLRVRVIVIVGWDTPVVMMVIICIARSMVVVIIDWVVEITARVLVIANHAAADRVDKDALIVAESRKIEDRDGFTDDCVFAGKVNQLIRQHIIDCSVLLNIDFSDSAALLVLIRILHLPLVEFLEWAELSAECVADAFC